MDEFSTSPPGHVDRVAGTLVGLAAGDALGAAYELADAPPPGEAAMLGGGLGGWAPGEWTDDTQMAICIAETTATGAVDLTAIGERFLAWYASDPPDVGAQTRAVLADAASGADLTARAADHFAAHPHAAAGNGSLMRTAPVALAALGDDEALSDLPRRVSSLTHGDPLAADACVLWSVAIDRAVREARLDGVWDGLRLLAADRADFWRSRLAEAQRHPPSHFVPNGYVVTALQAACSAVWRTSVPDTRPGRHLQWALQAAVGAGDDTDTVAAIAGQLLGARWGVTAVPFAWRRLLHGWPGYRSRDLVRLAVLTAEHGVPEPSGWPAAEAMLPAYRYGAEPPAAAALRSDPGVLLGPVVALEHAEVAAEVDAVVSLCRVGPGDVPRGAEHIEVLLIDEPGANPNLELILDDAAEAIATLRGEGKQVFVHCAAGISRTAAVAARYLNRHQGRTPGEALDEVRAAIPHAAPNPELMAVLGHER